MKKALAGIITFFLILGVSSMAHAYSYTFNFQSGGISLHVADNCSLLSVVTTDDLVVDFDFDPPQGSMQLDYTASVDMTLGLFGMFDYKLELPDLALGRFQSVDPSWFLGDGTTAMHHVGTQPITTQFGEYSLTDATLDYDFTFTPSQDVDDRYAIGIDTLSLYGGNTSELLSGIINELNQSGESPIVLSAPFTVPMTIAGAVDLQADPVPVPAAVWLFGSGLLGLIGVKRRKK